MHPGYIKKNLHNDFAIIVLQQPMELGKHIDTICLQSQFDSPGQEDYIWNDCVATGWGKDEYGKEGQYQVIMKQVELDLVGHDQCQDDLRTTRLGPFFELHKSFNCAGGKGGKDTCTGDGGGPLVCQHKDNGQFYQVWIAMTLTLMNVLKPILSIFSDWHRIVGY